MRTIDPFVRAALVGIGRDAGAGSLTHTPVDQLAAGNDERAFLLRAGARDVYLRAGFRPPRAPGTIDAAPAESLRSCSPRLAEMLGDAIREGDAEVLRGALTDLGQAGLVLPHPLLPDVLAMRDRGLRTAALPILGERGRWLARMNAAWSWALEGTAGTDPVAQWEEGSEEQQLDALRATRAADAAGARARLAERLPKERAEQRAAFLGALQIGLSLDDEELLERALDDRSIAVRTAAASLLARLPGSAYAARMLARAEAAVRPAPQDGSSSLWAKVKTIGFVKSAPKLLVEPPAELDAAAARDIAVPKSQPGGSRALALTQIVAAVPLDSWTARFAMSPEQLVAHAGETDWAAALIEGWTLAAIRQQDAGWARVLVRIAGRDDLTLTAEQRLELARSLPAEDLMQLVLAAEAEDQGWPLAELLDTVPKPWPRDFATAWLSRMRQAAARSGSPRSYEVAATVEIAARALPPEVHESAMAEWTLTDESWTRADWQRRIHRLQQTIRIRKAIAEERER